MRTSWPSLLRSVTKSATRACWRPWSPGPQASAFGEDAYPTLALKTAALIESINHSRPLVDGNKRLSWFCAVVFLRLNGCDLMVETDDAEQLIVAVAGGTADLPVIAAWIESRAVRFIADPL